MCIESSEVRNQRKVNKKIEEQLARAKADARRQVKLLLLGTGESGKSTFMKQMRIIHDNGFSKAELEKKRVYVFHNTVQCMQLIVQAMKFLEIKLENQENQSLGEHLLQLDLSYTSAGVLFGSSHLPRQYVTCIENLWQDAGVRQCYERRNEYQLSDSAEYFFTNVARFGQTGYIPTYADIVRIRVPTTGILERIICINSVMLRIVDVGGQDNERLKWIHCFEGVTSIIFMTALNEYDMFKYKNNNTYNDSAYDQLRQFLSGHAENRVNRMRESLALFQVITSSPLLANSSFILFLNKKDLLEEKISRCPLGLTFPEYEGPVGDPEAARLFIKDMFLQHALMRTERLNPALANGSQKHSYADPSTTIYAHFTVATDTENIKFVFDSVRHTILREHLDEFFFQ